MVWGKRLFIFVGKTDRLQHPLKVGIKVRIFSEDTEIISKMLEEPDSNEEEKEVEEEDFHLHYSDTEEIENLISENNLLNNDADIPATILEEQNESCKPTVIKQTLNPDPPTRDRIQTRSQTAKCKKNVEKSAKENDPPDNENRRYRKKKQRLRNRGKTINCTILRRMKN